MKKNRPSFLTNRKRTVIALRLALLAGAAHAFALGASRPSELPGLGLHAPSAPLLVTALSAGYLAEDVHETEERGRRFEGFYRSLFEQSAEGLLVAGAGGA